MQLQTKAKKTKSSSLLKFEKEALAKGFKKIAGLDEAGRGPLAGPVVACACLIEAGIRFNGINDCKLLTPLRRNYFFKRLTTHPKVKLGLGIIDAATIDQVNIYQATKLAMLQALDNLGELPDYLLVDAMKLSYKDIPCESIIHGDTLSQSIAAASIIAKVTRDEIMTKLDLEFPNYGFKSHKGYGTEQHLKALAEYGPTPYHRRSFAPVTLHTTV